MIQTPIMRPDHAEEPDLYMEAPTIRTWGSVVPYHQYGDHEGITLLLISAP